VYIRPGVGEIDKSTEKSSIRRRISERLSSAKTKMGAKPNISISLIRSSNTCVFLRYSFDFFLYISTSVLS